MLKIKIKPGTKQALLRISFEDPRMHLNSDGWYIDVDGQVADFFADGQQRKMLLAQMQTIAPALQRLIALFEPHGRNIEEVTNYNGTAGPSHALRDGILYLLEQGLDSFKEINPGGSFEEVNYGGVNPKSMGFWEKVEAKGWRPGLDVMQFLAPEVGALMRGELVLSPEKRKQAAEIHLKEFFDD